MSSIYLLHDGALGTQVTAALLALTPPPNVIEVGKVSVDLERRQSLLRRCDVVFAIFPATSSSVMFEAGMAIGFGKPVIAVADSWEDIPSDLGSYPAVRLQDLLDDPTKALTGVFPKVPALQGIDDETTVIGSATRKTSDLGRLPTMSPREIEELAITLLSREYHSIRRSAETGNPKRDVGADLFLYDPAGALVAVAEIKAFSSHMLVSTGIVHQLLGTVLATGAREGILITSGSYTESARHFAKASPIPIRLLSFAELLESN